MLNLTQSIICSRTDWVMRFVVSAICIWQCFFFLLCACYYMPLELHFYADPNTIHFVIAELTEIWYILTCITQLGLVITFIFLFLACFYIPLEWEFYAESNAINHVSTQVELTELWGFLYLHLHMAMFPFFSFAIPHLWSS